MSMRSKKRPPQPKPSAFKRKLSIDQDPFFNEDAAPNKKVPKHKKVLDEEIESSDEGDSSHSDSQMSALRRKLGSQEEHGYPDSDLEIPDVRTKRLASQILARSKNILQQESDDESEDEDGVDASVARRLQLEQLEDSGRLQRKLAFRVLKPEPTAGFELLVKHRQSVTAVALTEDDIRGFSASKDGNILHWDVETGNTEKYKWPSDLVLKSHGMKQTQGRALRHSKQVLALAVSSDGRYLATGGLDRHVHLWDTRTREHIQAFSGHRGAVSCLTFRKGSDQIFSGSYDRSIKIWSANDRTYMDTLFGFESEVLFIDSLRKERALAVGRDRTMQLFKVPEGTRLKFLAPASSLECCCFISTDDFLSGDDNGSVAVWNVKRKKPVCIVKNAHAMLRGDRCYEQSNGGEVLANREENGKRSPENHINVSVESWVSALCVSTGSDLAASGAGNGCIRLWSIENERLGIQHLYDLPLVGFVNSLAFAKSGKFLLAGVGQEPRFGRWGNLPAAENGVSIQTLQLSGN